MAFGVADFEDLLKLLSEHPEWRAQLRPVVLSEEMLPLPSRPDRVESALEALTLRVEQLTEQVSSLTVAMTALTTRFDRMDGRMGNIEDDLLELKFHQNMPNWVRHYLRKPSRVFVDELPDLERALSAGTITDLKSTISPL